MKTFSIKSNIFGIIELDKVKTREEAINFVEKYFHGNGEVQLIETTWERTSQTPTLINTDEK